MAETQTYYQEHKKERKVYYQKHKNRILKYRERYSKTHKKEIAEYWRVYYKNHKDDKLSYQKGYYQYNKDERLKYQNQYSREHKKEIRNYREKRKKEKPYRKLGDFLTRRLKEINKNQAWLAEQIGVSRGCVSRYSAGVVCPRNKLRRKLCEVLEIKISDLEKLVENGKR